MCEGQLAECQRDAGSLARHGIDADPAADGDGEVPDEVEAEVVLSGWVVFGEPGILDEKNLPGLL